MKAYLAGAIEHSPDRGEAWRQAMTRFCDQELNHSCYNPLIEENHYITPEQSRQFRGWKFTDLPRFQQTVRKLIRGDLAVLENEIDYVICYWDGFVERGGGTYGELTLAFHRHIPVYMVAAKPVIEISGWILGCTTEIFDSFKALKVFLKAKYT